MTREQAAVAAAEPLAAAYRTLYGLDGATVEQAAQAAITPTGPELPELVRRITELRAKAAAA